MTNSFGEFGNASMFLVIGSNMTEAHPVAATFLKNAVVRGAKLVVVDPRKHKLVDFADAHLPLKSGTDVALLNGLMHVLIRDEIYDKEFVADHCENFDALRKTVLRYTPEYVAGICGIEADELVKVAHMLTEYGPVMICYTLGITEHSCGTENVMSVASLQMLLGGIGKPGAGVNPLRGQNNVQGACDMGCSPDVLPGYVKVFNDEGRKRFEDLWGVQLPSEPGMMMPDLFESLPDRRIRGLWIFGENVVNTEPDIAKVEHELSSAEFLVVQDLFHNETTRFADVILPAKAWGEKDGTFTNSERRVSRVRAAAPAPGEAMEDWWIFKEVARRCGHEWAADSAQEIWEQELLPLCAPFAGIKYRRIENNGLQWPCPDENHPGTVYLHKDGNFARGKGLLNAFEWRPPQEETDDDYPLLLSTGRSLSHYHTRTQTGNSIGINSIMSEELADIAPADAAALGIEDGAWIRVTSRRGQVDIRANVSERMRPGMVWMTFHFRETNANWLTNPRALDNITKTAEYKACAVKIAPIAGPERKVENLEPLVKKRETVT
jgi:formate dehydrogenase major subunit